MKEDRATQAAGGTRLQPLNHSRRQFLRYSAMASAAAALAGVTTGAGAKENDPDSCSGGP